MFHANGWGIPFAAVMTGARIVFTGRDLQPADIAALIQDERVTFTAGVPTIWMSLYGYLETLPARSFSLRMVVAAGSAMPRQFIEWYEKTYGVPFPAGLGHDRDHTRSQLSRRSRLTWKNYPKKQHFDLLARHGLPVAGVDIRIVDAEGIEIALGRLYHG